ncbi:MAG: type II toxin-antitoxin system VapC family toxin [Verrucomicrobia bacterium]|nr:type II toxin-antitoxin system VapC family toxin [Verrucomicrobiota bacterium]
MAANGQRRLALDTNLLLDLAAGENFALEFREVFQGRGYALFVPPTVGVELLWKQKYDPAKRQLAQHALLRMREWGIRTIELSDMKSALAEQFARRLLLNQLLPEGEFNDGMILGETAQSGIALLVTSDRHLLSIEEEALLLAFQDAGLSPVRAAHPKRLVRALR